MMNRVGDQIAAGRKNSGLTQEELAARLGVTPQAVSRWERGQGMPDICLVGGICQVLNISADDLLGVEVVGALTEDHDAAMKKEIQGSMIADPLLLEFGVGLTPVFEEGLKTDYVNQRRKELAYETGILLPLVRIRDNEKLHDYEYRIISYDTILRQGVWEETGEERYERLIDQVVKACAERYDFILNKQMVKNIIDNLKALYPGIADGIIPEKIGYLQMLELMREIFRKKRSLHNMIRIVEAAEQAIVVNGETDSKSIAKQVISRLDQETEA